MKQNIRFADHIRLAIIVFFWLSSLLVAGSDSIIMPWLNVLGLGVFMVSSAVLGHAVRRLHHSPSQTGLSHGADPHLAVRKSGNHRRPLPWRQPVKQGINCAQGV